MYNAVLFYMNNNIIFAKLKITQQSLMISRQTIDRIMDSVNIVDVVSEFVSLRKAGVNYKGLCPFHDDTTPSFMVSPSKNICKCFACGKGGDAVRFLMEHEQITYPDALRWLAAKYNIEIEDHELSAEELREQNERESMFIINEWAKDYFHNILNTDVDGQAIGKQYFRSRGIRDDIIRKFQLGFAPTSRTALSTEAKAKGYQEEFLLKTGLCYAKDNGELVDRYSGRVIFPWLNISGRVCAFGGRLLDSRTKGVQQKYVNSPESDIYHKDHELYGLFQAKKAIAKEDLVYMVEGYTDVIAMHQCGIENVVANSGTALSTHQIRLLHRFTSNIVLLYDGDEAGIHAAMRGTDMLLAEGMNIKVLILPDGDDPDSFAHKHSAEELRRYITDHQTDFIQFKTDQMLRGVTDPIKRSEAIGSIVKSISVIQNQIVRDTYLRECSQRLGVKEQALLITMNNYIRNDREEKQKEREREQRREQLGLTANGNGNPPNNNDNTPNGNSNASTTPPTGPQQPQPFIGLHTLGEQASEVERLLIQTVIRHGNEIIFPAVETDSGETISLSVAQYVQYDLGQDDLLFSNPLYNRILAEAVEHNDDAGFRAENYFMQHPDADISSLAVALVTDHYVMAQEQSTAEADKTETDRELDAEEIARIKAKQQNELRQHTIHLILDFRMDIIERRLKDIHREMRQAAGDMNRLVQLMQEYKDTQLIRNALANELGVEVFD